MKRLAGEIALVTGGASGIGRATAEKLAALGAQVVVADRNGDGAEHVAQLLRDGGSAALAVMMDVTKRESVRAGIERARTILGPITILVSAAGWDRIQPFVENSPELWEQLIAVNLLGPIYVTREVIDDMIHARRGRLVFVSSDAARVGSSGEAVYSAAKGGLLSFAKTLARELARYQITANVVCPGPTETPLLDEVRSSEAGAKIIAAMTKAIPLGRLAKPEEVAAAIAFFAMPEAGFITGQVLSVSGGLTMVG
ncbi:3-oxoacyl-[acyl-carrier-protein] reductase FabG [bacterium HR30]|nr:3-oxoacyl-[acyl-carrier-protein] reductase FabG [bacterium HR30]